MKKSLTLALTLFFVLPLLAADKPEMTVKYRQTVMKAMAAHMGALSLVIRKQVSDRAHLAAHAEAIHAMAKDMAELFPPGSGPDQIKTAAKPEVWQHWNEFKAADEKLERESAKLAQLAAKGESKELEAQFAVVGDSCGSCHKTFRVRDND